MRSTWPARFGEALPLTGVILTKADGDARGGSALSVKTVTGRPIRFLGTGEEMEGLEDPSTRIEWRRVFSAWAMSLSLVEEVEQKVDREKAEKLANKVKRGKGFDLDDLREQLGQMLNMGDLEASARETARARRGQSGSGSPTRSTRSRPLGARSPSSTP